jgi:D-alanine transaminase
VEVYLNGKFVPYEQAVVSVEDRGFVFADGIYEVVRIYHGKPFLWQEHMDRLRRSAQAIRLKLPAMEELTQAGFETMRRSQLDDATLYIQITRGAAPRLHSFPVGVEPTVFMIARPYHRPAATMVQKGIACITVPDLRWHKCSIKTVGLLLNVIAKQEAEDAGADDAVFVRDDVITEGTSSNFFMVKDGTLITHPADDFILRGITRDFVIELAEEMGIPVREEYITRDALSQSDEAFLTSTGVEVLPVTVIDGQKVGSGRPGPVTMRLWERFDQVVAESVE